MEYYLKHKNITVLEMNIDDVTASIAKIGEVYEIAHVPMGIRCNNGIVDRQTLNAWWSGRCIPASRDKIKEALEAVGEYTTQALLIKNLGLSLSDGYWICPREQSLQWEDINFFENKFSKDMGEILFGNKLDTFSLRSPDNTSDGWLKKKWIIIDEKRCLIKGSSGRGEEPLNEVIATNILERLHIPHIPYKLIWEDDMPYSICENFIDANTELISAHSIYSNDKKINHVSSYEHIIRCYESLGIKNVRESIDKMLVLDYLIANTDRHMNNFGIIRDSNTLDALSVAPIFDSGTSMWMNVPNNSDKIDGDSKPFANKHSKQIQLVSSFKWLDMTLLEGIIPEIDAVLQQSPFMDDVRRTFLLRNLTDRMETLQKIMQDKA